MFRDVVRSWRAGPDDFGFLALVVVPGFNVEDFVAACHQAARIAFAQVSVVRMVGMRGSPVLWISPIADERRECRPSERLHP